MARTRHHGKNFNRFYLEAHKNRAIGYEYWTSRPGNFGGSSPGATSKTITKKRERSREKQLVFNELHKV